MFFPKQITKATWDGELLELLLHIVVRMTSKLCYFMFKLESQTQSITSRVDKTIIRGLFLALL
jgi:hypothetical protein